MVDIVNHRHSTGDAVRAVDVLAVSLKESDVADWDLLQQPLEPHMIRLPDDPLPRYLAGPVTPHLLRLVPGDRDSIEDFVAKLGWFDLAHWAYTAVPNESVAQDLWVNAQSIPPEGPDQAERWYESIYDAWLHPDTEQAFSRSQGMLGVAWSSAARQDWSQAKRLSWMSGFYRRPDEIVPPRTSSEHPALRLALEPRGDPPRLVLVPTDIFARSYLELAHLLWRRQLTPTRCAHCHQWFPPKRDGQRFCHGSSCKKDHDAAYAKHPYRKEYQKMYARYRRRTITQNEWDDWRDRNPGPDQWEGANPNGVGTED